MTVNFAAADGSATIARATTSRGRSRHLRPGVTAQPVVVLVNGDTTQEPDENFFVNLSGPVERDDPRRRGAGDDPERRRAEPDLLGRRRDAVGRERRDDDLLVHREPDARLGVARDGDRLDGQRDGHDGRRRLRRRRSRSSAFPAGVTSQTFSVTVNGDTKREPDETFTVALSLNSGTTVLAPARAPGRSRTTTRSRRSRSTTSRRWKGTRERPPSPSRSRSRTRPPRRSPSTTRRRTGRPPSPNADYVAASGHADVPARGHERSPSTVNVNGDTTNEGLEFFAVNLTNGVNARDRRHPGPGEHPERRLADAHVLDRERLAGRGERGHDDVHLHGEPLAGGRGGRRA